MTDTLLTIIVLLLLFRVIQAHVHNQRILEMLDALGDMTSDHLQTIRKAIQNDNHDQTQ